MNPEISNFFPRRTDPTRSAMEFFELKHGAVFSLESILSGGVSAASSFRIPDCRRTGPMIPVCQP
ncbi:MAG: hypothetical protein ACXW0O_10615 [Methylosarcina sp.]